MKTVLVMLLVFSLFGCSGCTALDVARSKGAEYYDEALNTAIRVICNDTSIGSIKRRFGGSQESMDKWRDFCFGGEIDLEVDE
ncbi:MAG: hypothetical protein KAJ10_11710 [Thermodesulfovibrionia bacterium]|nr:hypothetical protein [Thermodesulfovibrionia bacterium]